MTEIVEHQIIWFPGIYNGREGPYATFVADLPEDEVVWLVQERAKEDGEWAIENGHVGQNEDVMRQMMEWVSREDNIRQCVEWVRREKTGVAITVDWVCRHLANGSKWIAEGGTRG